MANVISSVGYTLEKVHSGMIAYLCDLHREGVTTPLESLFGALHVSVPKTPVPQREWNSLDLAIFEGDATRWRSAFLFLLGFLLCSHEFPP
jgi:hypothetical protein